MRNRNRHSLWSIALAFALALAATGAEAVIQAQTKSTAGTVTPSGNWGTPNSAASIDGFCANGDGSTSSALTLTNWGFAIPAGGTILGVQVRSVSEYNAVSTEQIQLTDGGAIGAAKTLGAGNGVGALCSNLVDQTVGATNDVWGAALTPAIVNGAAFGAIYDNGFLNASVDGLEITVTYDDGQATGVTINQAVGQSDPTNASPVNFTVVFSEAVTGFTAAGVSLVASTAGGTLVANVTPVNATTYTVSVTGMTTDGTVVATILAGAALDSSNQPSTASTSTDNTVNYDVTAPTVIINQSGIQTDPTNAAPIQFTATFSEAVTGFTGADISFAGTTAGGALSAVVAGGPAVYTVVVNGMTSSGIVVASIPAGAATDLAGNANVASTSIDNTVTYDITPPSVTINQAATQADPTNAGPIVFGVVFSEAVTGFNPGDVSLNGTTVGGALSIAVNGGGANYTVSVTGMSGTGVVVASIPAAGAFDAANNPSLASTSTDNTVTFDNVPPSVTIEQAPAQADPTHALPIFFRATFSEPITGFTAGDVVLSGTIGSAAIQISGGPTEYLIEVGSISVPGTVVVTLPAGAVTDLAGNPSLASTSVDNSVTYLGQLFIPTLAPMVLAMLALLLAAVAGLAFARRRR